MFHMLFAKKKIMIKKTKNKKNLPTYPNFFEHVTPNRHIFFWPKAELFDDITAYLSETQLKKHLTCDVQLEQWKI